MSSASLTTPFFLVRRMGSDDEAWEVADQEQIDALEGSPHWEVARCRLEDREEQPDWQYVHHMEQCAHGGTLFKIDRLLQWANACESSAGVQKETAPKDGTLRWVYQGREEAYRDVRGHIEELLKEVPTDCSQPSGEEGEGEEQRDFYEWPEYERIARAFHATYEEIAPNYDYETRPESRKLWAELPFKNRALMVGTVRRLVETGLIEITHPHDQEAPEVSWDDSDESDRERADRLEVECRELEDANRSLAKMRDAALEGNLATQVSLGAVAEAVERLRERVPPDYPHLRVPGDSAGDERAQYRADLITVLDAHDRLDPQATNGRSAEDSLVGTMETIDLFNALRRLRSDSERAALVDRMAGYTFKEIARRRGWTYTKVERCIREGREKVQGLMSDAASGAAVGS